MEAVPATHEIELLLAESEWVGRLALGLVGDAHGAEDLAQETWLAALRHPPLKGLSGARGDSPRPWLATVARNAVRFGRRSEAARRDRESERASERSGETDVAPEELLERLETQELVSRLVRELPPELAEVLMLSFYEGRSAAWIARERGIPAGTVRWRKQRALELLRERLDTRYGGDRSAWLSALTPLAATWSRRGASAAAGGGLLAGLLAPWFAMSLSLKLFALLGISLLAALPFVQRSDPRPAPAPGAEPVSAPEVALVPAPDLEVAPPASSTITHGDRAPAPVAVPVAAADADAPLVTRVRLLVVDELGRPVEGALVKPSPSLALQSAHRFLEEELGALRMLTLVAEMARRTGPDGAAAWETDLLREAGLVDFEVEGPNFEAGSLRVELEPGMDEDLGEVVLRPAGAVKGRLRTRTGERPGKCVIELGPVELPTDERALERLAQSGPDEATGYVHTRESGRFQLTGIPPGEYRAYARPLLQGAASWSAPLVVTAGLATEGIEFEVEPVLRRSAEILVLGADGEPLSTAEVRVEGESISMSGSVGKDGRYLIGPSFAHVAGGRATITDNSFEHRAAVVDPLPNEPERVVVQLEPAEIEEHVLQLVGADGSSVTEANVVVTGQAGARWWNEVEGAVALVVPADSEGVFDLSVRARGFAPAKLEGLEASALPDEWVLELVPQRGIAGIVLSGGEPLERARVELRWQVEAGSVALDGTAVNRVQGYAIDAARTGADGSFRLHGDVDGDLALVVTRRGQAEETLLLGGYVAAEGWPDLVVELDGGGTVRGTVVDHTGAPVHGANVVIDHPLHPLRSGRTKRDGTFRFRRVTAGDWYVRVVDEVEEGFFSWTTETPEGWEYPANCAVGTGAEVRIELTLPDPEGVSVAGRVQVGGAERGAVRAHVSAADAGSFRNDPFAERWEAAAELDDGGRFEVRLRDGRDYSLELEVPGLAARLRRDVPAAELPAWVELEVALAELVLRREIPLSAGEGDRGVLVTWRGEDWAFDAWVERDAEGRLAPLRVPAGELELAWKDAAGEGCERRVRLAAGERLEVVLE